MLQAAILFQDDMVIQRDKKIAVWGTADAGARITVTMQQKTASVAADDCGNWLVFCGPFSTSFQEIMLIASDRDSLVLRNIQVGEVWLAGGQSNMEFHMRYDADLAVEKEICENKNIRFFDYPEVSYVGQINEADYRRNYGFWRTADREQLERFSAVGYYFAKELQARYHVPIGIIGCNWGGTPACAWMSREAIAEGGGQIYLDEYEESVKSLDLTDYEQRFKNDPQSWRVDQLDSPISDILMFGGTPEEIYAKIKKTGIDLSAAAFPGIGPKYEGRPSGLYESMLKPLAPYTIRGVIWYQGETDGDNHPEVYQTLFPALIRNWRTLWNEDLPFLFVQIAPLDRWQDCRGERYVMIRSAQQYTADTVPGTGMAVTSDVGMEFDIHPKKKSPVGRRLALLAGKKVYGENILCEAPALSAVKVETGKLILTFDNAGDGLYLSETVPYGQIVGAERLGGLQVFQNGQERNSNRFIAQAEGDQVTVLCEEIRSDVPTQVRLAKTGWYLVNLYNSAGIPARPGEMTV